MKRKLNLILIQISIAIFGIMYFQVDWMFKTYNSEKDRLWNAANTYLADALEKHNTEQRASDSTFLYNKLKNWADTVKMKYVNDGDSLHINLENPHPKIEYKQGGPFYMRMTMPTTNGISIMSPSYLSNFGNVGRKPISKALTREASKHTTSAQLIDSLEFFFRPSYVPPSDIYNETFFKVLTKKTRAQAFKADSIRILKYFKNAVHEYGGDDLADDARIYFSSLGGNEAQGVYLNQYIRFHQNVLHRYPNKQWVGYYLPHSNAWLIKKIIVKVLISLALIANLILAFQFLIKIIKQQKQLADIKDDFIDNLTHEFKTPIATISAAIEGMQKFNALENKEKTARYLEISKSELTRLNDMVTKLLNISVYEKNNLTLSLHHVDLVQLVSDVMTMEKFRAVKPVKFTVDIAEDVRHITADPLHFKNVLINLVDNAVKYSNDAVDITFIGLNIKNQLVLKVNDNGIGIPANQLKHVFDKFYRVPTGDLHNVKGSGLGLSYVRSVVEAHGGTISVNSEINVRTEFIISIPLK
jgi:signal transduction histidine kinase